jgi:xylan 1,4-beta-xylosidase
VSVEREDGWRVREEWERAVVRPRGTAVAEEAWRAIDPPTLRAESGAGQVTLRWHPAEGAAGYLVYRSNAPDGAYVLLDHGGGDLVKAVPGPAYCDTTGVRDESAWYRLAAIPAADAPPGPMSEPVQARPQSRMAAPVSVVVDASRELGVLPRPWRMVGAEHLSQLLYTQRFQGIEIGTDYLDAFRLVHEELGVGLVRAHSIFHDELGVYREEGDRPIYDFSGIDRVFDQLRELGIRPVIELSFMPRALARDPTRIVFKYRGIVSPPKDWRRWRDLVAALAQHLVDRYGLDQVSSWAFEVWNEPNLEGFWAGSRSEYFRLYDESAAAIKSVSSRLRIGGPATAAAAWIGDMATHVLMDRVPLDFLSTHIYGTLPLDIEATMRNMELPPVPVWWTEWGVSPGHFRSVNDAAFGVPFILHGMLAAIGRAEYLAYWVLSDHFEELGRPPRLFHGGFGLLTVGNLRKPRYWAIYLLQLLGRQRLAVRLEGDGAESLVNSLAGKAPNGDVQVLIWNGTLDQSKIHGDPLLDREINLQIANLATGPYRLEHFRVDETHSNILSAWQSMGSPDWPNPEGWESLRAANRLETIDPPREVRPRNRALTVSFKLPMPGASFVQLKRLN